MPDSEDAGVRPVFVPVAVTVLVAVAKGVAHHLETKRGEPRACAPPRVLGHRPRRKISRHRAR